MVALVVFVRLRLLQIPLERDEGEYAYAGQLMLEGVPPYQMAWNMKLPGTYAAYALMMALFGQTIGGIHFGFLLANLGALALLYLHRPAPDRFLGGGHGLRQLTRCCRSVPAFSAWRDTPRTW